MKIQFSYDTFIYGNSKSFFSKSQYILYILAIIATNLRASFQITQLAIPHLIESKGNIVNVSSVAGMLAFENFLSYSISKAALDQFTKCVAMEVSLPGR